MFGINYRYEINETKKTIKLAPTKGVWLATVAAVLFTWGPLLTLIVVEDYSSRKETTDDSEVPTEND